MMRLSGGRRPSAHVWALAANALIGIPAMVPLHSALWLLNRRWSEGNSLAEASSTIIEVCSGDCQATDLAWLALAVTGALVLLLVLVVDLIVPLQRDRPLGPWVKATLLIPVPYLIALPFLL
ncbi:hypothetical protein [Streptomyces sp. NPDC059009]|uniref:hypothetical protein n=1 Tax=Streptomyces sp. NPDC059009 TaxID=3346694 RepID=UPI0036A1C107